MAGDEAGSRAAMFDADDRLASDRPVDEAPASAANLDAKREASESTSTR